MNLIFWGFIFALWNYSLNLGSFTIGIVPDVIGFILLWNGIKKLFDKSETFKKAYLPCEIMIFVSTAYYICDLFRVFPTLFSSSVIITLISLIYYLAKYYVIFLVIKGIEDVENKTNFKLYSDSLKKRLLILAVSTVLVFVLRFVFPVFSAFMTIFQLLMEAFVLVRMYDSMKNYTGQISK